FPTITAAKCGTFSPLAFIFFTSSAISFLISLLIFLPSKIVIYFKFSVAVEKLCDLSTPLEVTPLIKKDELPHPFHSLHHCFAFTTLHHFHHFVHLVKLL